MTGEDQSADYDPDEDQEADLHTRNPEADLLTTDVEPESSES